MCTSTLGKRSNSYLNVFWNPTLKIYFTLCVYVCACTHYGAWMEDRGQFLGICSTIQILWIKLRLSDWVRRQTLLITEPCCWVQNNVRGFSSIGMVILLMYYKVCVVFFFQNELFSAKDVKHWIFLGKNTCLKQLYFKLIILKYTAPFTPTFQLSQWI